MRITVVGAGRSGLAAAMLAKKSGDNVFVTEASSKEHHQDAARLLDGHGVATEFGFHSSRALCADLIIVSPGIPPSHPLRIAAAEAGIPVIGELEYASQFVSNRIVAVTGTNGKTTTTALITHILQHGGVRAIACGNIGTPMSAIVDSVEASDVLVVEASSFQLDTTVQFKPFVSIILNITPDHLGYHGSFQAYVESKWKIFARQDANNLVLLNADDEHTLAAAPLVGCTTAFFSTQREVEGAFVRGGDVVFRSSNREEIFMPTRHLGLPGLHNTYNSMASALASRAFEVSNESIRDSLSSFDGVEHRLENIRIHNGVRWVNDSKATNVNAAWYALASFDHPLIWVAGGRADSNDYSLLDDLVATNVKAIVCIGEQADTIFNRWCTTHRCVKVHSMDEAVCAAADLAEVADIVLLSPACKSFDMFSSYEERGQVFKEAVLKL